MAFRYTLEQYRAVLGKRMKALRDAGIKSSMQAASYMVIQAKRLAPRYTGATIAGIIKRKHGKGYMVISSVPGSFKQNLFANQTAPYRTIHYPKGAWIPPSKSWNGKWTMIAPPGTVARYGESPNWNWTAKPRFFHFAALRTRPYFRDIARKNTRKALRTTF